MAVRRSTGRAAATYVVLAALQRGVSFLILPFITHALPPGEYGAASMLSTTSVLLAVVIATPLIQLIIRAAARGGETGPALLRAMGTYCYFVLPVVVAFGAAVISIAVPQILGVAGHIWGIELLATGLQPAASVYALAVVQAREDVHRFTLISLTSVVVTAASKLALVVQLDMGVLGWALSDLVSAVISAAMALLIVRRPRARVRARDIRYILSFCAPLIPHSAAFWALTSASRPAMAAVSTFDQVGLLSFGLNLAQIAGLVLGETNRAALIRYSRETFPAPTRQTFNLVKWQLLAAFVVPATVGVGVAIGGQRLFAEAYWTSFPLTGILLIGQAALGLYLIPMNYLTQTAGLPKYSALASGAGAVVIMGWIACYGHKYGAIGVACATAAGYLMMAAVAMILTLSHGLDIEWRAWLRTWPEMLLAGAGLACAVTALAAPSGTPAVWATVGVCFVCMSTAVVLSIRRTGGKR